MTRGAGQGRGARRLALAGAAVLACVGPAVALTDAPPVTFPGVFDGAAADARPVDRPLSLAQLVYPTLSYSQPVYPPPSYPSLAYPPVTYGPPAAPPADAAPAAQSSAPTRPTGSRCKVVLLLAERTEFCPLKAPLALGAACACPYPPPPPGIRRSRPQPGHVIS